MTSRFDDTIAAITTSPVTAGVGIIRMSGIDSKQVLHRLMPSLPATIESRRLNYGAIVHPVTLARLDVGYGVWIKGPKSFTGEDVTELQAHGGVLNLQRLLEAALRAGCRVAEPGEFTRRAFLNGKLDLSQAEAILDIVEATSWVGLETAQSQHAGILRETLDVLRHQVLGIIAHLEVNIDFVHEDVPLFGAQAILARMNGVLTQIRELVQSYNLGRVLREGIVIALVGRPNTGKSSLFNAILRDERSIVTPIPGTTRDYLEERSDIGGVPVVLVDTAGIRQTEDPVEKLGVSRTHERLQQADIILVLHDGFAPPVFDELTWAPPEHQARCVHVLNKADLGTDSRWDEYLPGALRISATTGAGIHELLEHLRTKALGCSDGSTHRVIITRARHKEALLRADDAMTRAVGALSEHMPFEIVSGELQLTLEAISDIVGISTHDDILDRIFSEFCLGK